ncbi:MAG: XRE family transcriptional regulator [Parcubacteria group bacterium Gr01-1014_73]|nr:MAG: XRE family transcriptional regulator [Parcubacteria group bacterium Gr01-1014_73]
MTRTKSQFYLGIILGGLAALIIVGYALYETWNYFSGPTISVLSPNNGATLNEPLLEIQGVVKNAATVFLNGRRILTNDKGEFKERLLLAEGYNIISLKTEDKFKRTAEQRLELVYKKK